MYVILQLQHSVGDVSNSTSSTVQSLTELVVFFFCYANGPVRDQTTARDFIFKLKGTSREEESMFWLESPVQLDRISKKSKLTFYTHCVQKV